LCHVSPSPKYISVEQEREASSWKVGGVFVIPSHESGCPLRFSAFNLTGYWTVDVRPGQHFGGPSKSRKSRKKGVNGAREVKGEGSRTGISESRKPLCEISRITQIIAFLHLYYA